MRTLSGLSSSPIQTFRNPLDDGSIVKFVISFRPSVAMWYMDIEYKTFIVKGLRIVNSLNMLCQYKNVIPFGVYINIPDKTEPFLINDFQSGRVIINVLNQTEVNELEEFYQGLNL